MEGQFQIEQIEYQDSVETEYKVIARDLPQSRAPQRVLLTVFSVNPEMLLKLNRCDVHGQSLFKQSLTWLQSCEVAHFRAILGGGFNEQEQTFYLLTEWVEGLTIEQAMSEGWLNDGDGAVFEAQAQKLLLALPSDIREAVTFIQRAVLVTRGERGALNWSFGLSPRHYFNTVVGTGLKCTHHEKQISELKARFPESSNPPPPSQLLTTGSPLVGSLLADSPLAPSVVTGSPSHSGQSAHSLPSAQQGTGQGLLWIVVCTTLLVGGLFGSLFLKPHFVKKAPLVPLSQTLSNEGMDLSASDSEPESETIESVPRQVTQKDKDPVEGAIEKRATLAKLPVVALPSGSELMDSETVFIDDSLEEDLNDFGPTEDEPLPTESAEEEPLAIVEEPLKNERTAGTFSPDELTELTSRNGEIILLEGTVAESNHSGGGQTLWYLDFGDRRTQCFIVFRHGSNPQPIERSDWDAFVGKEILVSGRVKVSQSRMKRGSGVQIIITQISDVTAKPTIPVFHHSQRASLLVTSEGQQVCYEATLKNFRKIGDSVYLVFREGPQVVGRFNAQGPLATREFANELKNLFGQKIQLTGTVRQDPHSSIEYSIDFQQRAALSVAK